MAGGIVPRSFNYVTLVSPGKRPGEEDVTEVVAVFVVVVVIFTIVVYADSLSHPDAHRQSSSTRPDR
eukprot:3531884-Pyramimonas_sp.AAC.1